MITLLWLTNRESSWETDWIEFLFQDIEHRTETDYSFSKEINNSILIYNSNSFNINYFQNLNQKGKKFGLIHLSDEWNKDPTDHYGLAKFVLRNYYKNINPNVLNFPLGWIQQFPENLNIKTLLERNLTWSFSGHVDKTTRPEMAKFMSTIPGGKGYFKKCGEIWGPTGHALDPIQLAHMYNDSVFVPCPRGNCSIDSFRVTEALQSGALPIVEMDSYWNNMYGTDNPIIQISSWEAAPRVISNLLSDPQRLEIQRKTTHEWWIDHCRSVKRNIETLINNLYDN